MCAGAACAAALAVLLGLPPAGAHDVKLHKAKVADLQARYVVDESDGTRFAVPEPGTYRLPVLKDAVDGAVLGTDGEARRLLDLIAGRIGILSFIYTRCSDDNGCPMATAVFMGLEDAIVGDPELARAVRLVSLSFDPLHDTPDVMANYAGDDPTASGGTPPLWAFLTCASQAELRPILDGYGQYVVPEVDEEGRPTSTYSHVLKVFLIDRQRRVRNIYSSAFLYPKLVLADVRTLLLEEARGTN